ncbi:hypothetical protein [Fulvivirga lutea]|uniref:Uncharacterized protein n=1 Tax=Fulvivirga lutea TaxID=2810512 RepID=A0A974WJE9_9BACT|nr:hypothetical protein [Fulvivirga lutea]QSE96438.1 hypothetical protein JR347_12600 [Fulvivirga lutea]
MESIKDWENNVNKITSRIYNEFPELSKYITEIPFQETVSEESNIEAIKSYYFSLEELVSKYAKMH